MGVGNDFVSEVRQWCLAKIFLLIAWNNKMYEHTSVWFQKSNARCPSLDDVVKNRNTFILLISNDDVIHKHANISHILMENNKF